MKTSFVNMPTSTDLHLWENSAGTYEITRILTHKNDRRRGGATTVLRQMCDAADRAHVTVLADPTPYRERNNISRTGIIRLLARHGFTPGGPDGMLVRHPR